MNSNTSATLRFQPFGGRLFGLTRGAFGVVAHMMATRVILKAPNPMLLAVSPFAFQLFLDHADAKHMSPSKLHQQAIRTRVDNDIYVII